jgi:hypothetical protein
MQSVLCPRVHEEKQGMETAFMSLQMILCNKKTYRSPFRFLQFPHMEMFGEGMTKTTSCLLLFVYITGKTVNILYKMEKKTEYFKITFENLIAENHYK